MHIACYVYRYRCFDTDRYTQFLIYTKYTHNLFVLI